MTVARTDKMEMSVRPLARPTAQARAAESHERFSLLQDAADTDRAERRAQGRQMADQADDARRAEMRTAEARALTARRDARKPGAEGSLARTVRENAKEGTKASGFAGNAHSPGSADAPKKRAEDPAANPASDTTRRSDGRTGATKGTGATDPASAAKPVPKGTGDGTIADEPGLGATAGTGTAQPGSVESEGQDGDATEDRAKESEAAGIGDRPPEGAAGPVLLLVPSPVAASIQAAPEAEGYGGAGTVTDPALASSQPGAAVAASLNTSFAPPLAAPLAAAAGAATAGTAVQGEIVKGEVAKEEVATGRVAKAETARGEGAKGDVTGGAGTDAKGFEAILAAAGSGSEADLAPPSAPSPAPPAAATPGGPTGSSSAEAATGTASTPAQPAPIPLGAVPMTIGLRSLAGASRFAIRLDPVELGAIEVSLDLDRAGGRARAHLTVDRPETLALLQRDAGVLQQALAQAGFEANEGIALSLRGETNGQAGQNAGRDADRGNDSGARGRPGAMTGREADISAIDPSAFRRLRAAGGLDIRI
jgi:flagellar hook-length control protein FliK